LASGRYARTPATGSSPEGGLGVGGARRGQTAPSRRLTSWCKAKIAEIGGERGQNART
jgi:hypothetical protein